MKMKILLGAGVDWNLSKVARELSVGGVLSVIAWLRHLRATILYRWSSIGMMGWKSVGGLLLTSAVIMLSVKQELRLRSGVAAALDFLMAIVFCSVALVAAIRANLRGGVVICAMVLLSETLLILRWWLRRTSA